MAEMFVIESVTDAGERRRQKAFTDRERAIAEAERMPVRDGAFVLVLAAEAESAGQLLAGSGGETVWDSRDVRRRPITG